MIRVVAALWIFATALAFAGLLSVTTRSLVPEAQGLHGFDWRVLGYTYAEAFDYLSALGPRGREAYLGTVRLFDTVFAAGLAGILGGLVWGALHRGTTIARLLLLLPVGGFLVMDLAENALVAEMLRQGAGGLDPATATRAAEFTVTKYVLLAVSVVEIAALLGVALVRRAKAPEF